MECRGKIIKRTEITAALQSAFKDIKINRAYCRTVCRWISSYVPRPGTRFTVGEMLKVMLCAVNDHITKSTVMCKPTRHYKVCSFDLCKHVDKTPTYIASMRLGLLTKSTGESVPLPDVIDSDTSELLWQHMWIIPDGIKLQLPNNSPKIFVPHLKTLDVKYSDSIDYFAVYSMEFKFDDQIFTVSVTLVWPRSPPHRSRTWAAIATDNKTSSRPR